MKNNKMDAEYYVLDSDWLTSVKMEHPDLAFGDYDDTPFLEEERLQPGDLPSPFEVVFNEPYPKKYEMVDLHTLDTQFACTVPVQKIFAGVYGIDFFALDAVVTPGGERLEGYAATHVWNCIDALDMDNTVGVQKSGMGRIISMQRFSLSQPCLEAIELEKRLVFRLPYPVGMCILHASLAEKILEGDLKGFMLKRVDEWRRLI